MVEELGTVITTPTGPSDSSFSFVINLEKKAVKRGQYIAVETDEGTMVAHVTNIYKTNRYFESAGAVQEYNKAGELYSAFPVKEWEYTIADAKPLGVYSKEGMLNRPSFPPSPGNVITEVDDKMLNKFLGLDQGKGIDLGTVQQHELRASFNLTRMIQKHMAILAISGAGKSYATAVLIEELLSRESKSGRIALFAIDTHGEYADLQKDPNFGKNVKVIDATKVKIGVKNLNEKIFAALLPKMSPVQIRELGKVMASLRIQAGEYTIADILSYIKESSEVSKATAEALTGWLGGLDKLGVFSTKDSPKATDLLEQGKLVILDFKDILDLRRKQLIVNYLSRKLFNLRRLGKVPPYLQIIEEAHNFCPEGARAEAALSRGIIETLAREGRKFYANICLISQRPIQLSTTALSQCNTQIILKVTNPYDLDHIGKSSESISRSTLDIVSNLKVGEALVVGEAVNYPVFVKIKKRKSRETHGTKLEDYAILYENRNQLAKGKEFL